MKMIEWSIKTLPAFCLTYVKHRLLDQLLIDHLLGTHLPGVIMGAICFVPIFLIELAALRALKYLNEILRPLRRRIRLIGKAKWKKLNRHPQITFDPDAERAIHRLEEGLPSRSA